MDKWLKILMGLVLIIGVIILSYYSSVYNWTVLGKSLNFWHAGWEFLKGGIFWFIIMIGMLFLMLGISDLRE